MALSDLKILDELKKGTILIQPFDRASLSTSSYDVRLGEFFFREKKPPAAQRLTRLLGRKIIYNMYDREHNQRTWGQHHHEALPAYLCMKIKDLGNSIHPDERVILIDPGETLLAHTKEFIGGIRYHTSEMRARSSLGRNMIAVCKCAGWGDVGYINRWTMEITNYSRWRTIALVVGRPIAQIIFHETGMTMGNYGNSGQYQNHTDIQVIMQNWLPASMLPTLYKKYAD